MICTKINGKIKDFKSDYNMVWIKFQYKSCMHNAHIKIDIDIDVH